MKSHIIFIILVSCSLPGALVAQPNKDSKRDQVWIFGTDSSIQPGVDGVLLDFSTSPPSVSYQSKPIEMYLTDASICDTAGNLILYTNGLEIANKKHKILANSSGFYSGDLLKGLGLAMCQGILLLPVPGSDSLYVVIHPLVKASNDIFATKCSPIQYTLIDMSQSNSEGAAILLNQVITSDTFDNGMLTACRHANGRDWWVLLPKLASNIYYRLLLDPTGLHVDGKQTIGPVWGQVAGLGQSVFAPDGTHYARTRAYQYFDPDTMSVYDFDRCTGLLSNPHLMAHPTDSILAGAALAISPNSRYLYKSLGVYVWQYDLQAANLQASRQLVYTAKQYGFFAMQLGPDGKIYICPDGASSVLSRIDYPDLPGPACGVCEGCVTLPTPNYGSMPYFPNFRLGPVDGSACDSLGLSRVLEVEQGGAYKVYPNPVTDALTVRLPALLPGHALRFALTDALGRAVRERALTDFETEVEVAGLPKGMYFWQVSAGGVALQTGKIIVIQ